MPVSDEAIRSIFWNTAQYDLIRFGWLSYDEEGYSAQQMSDALRRSLTAAGHAPRSAAAEGDEAGTAAPVLALDALIKELRATANDFAARDPAPDSSAESYIEWQAADALAALTIRAEKAEQERDEALGNLERTAWALLDAEKATASEYRRGLEDAAKRNDQLRIAFERLARIYRDEDRHDAADAALQTSIVHASSAAAIRALQPQPSAAPQPTHRHKKRGTDYVLDRYGRMQSENWVSAQDMTEAILGNGPPAVNITVAGREVAIFHSTTSPTDTVVCPREEADSVFEALPDAPAPKGGA